MTTRVPPAFFTACWLLFGASSAWSAPLAPATQASVPFDLTACLVGFAFFVLAAAGMHWRRSARISSSLHSSNARYGLRAESGSSFEHTEPTPHLAEPPPQPAEAPRRAPAARGPHSGMLVHAGPHER